MSTIPTAVCLDAVHQVCMQIGTRFPALTDFLDTLSVAEHDAFLNTLAETLEVELEQHAQSILLGLREVIQADADLDRARGNLLIAHADRLEARLKQLAPP